MGLSFLTLCNASFLTRPVQLIFLTILQHQHFSTLKIEYNWPTLCTVYHSFIWYAGSYMFRHPCAIFRELLTSLLVTWRQKCLCCLSCTVNVMLSSWAHVCAQLDNITHETTTSAHRPPTFTVHDKQHKHFCLQVTHKDVRSSLKMAHGCRNM
jgi:hypothetical protein